MEGEKKESLRKRETTQITMAVDNLYNRCRKVVKFGYRIPVAGHSTEPMMIKKEETCSKLEVIANYLIDFDDMLRSIEEHRSQEQTY